MAHQKKKVKQRKPVSYFPADASQDILLPS